MDLLNDRRWVTDGGLETDLIFNRGVDLPEFAAFPLVEEASGREVLTQYFDGYADVARRAGAGLVMETPTWRANPDWGARLGYDAAALDRVNRGAVGFLHGRREAHGDLDAVLVGGTLGPRGDGYVAGERLSAEGYADYHRPQLASFKAADADLATVLTLVGTDEALGVVAAARDVGLPVAVGFTVETDGRLADGTPLRRGDRGRRRRGRPGLVRASTAPTRSTSRPGLDGAGPWDRIGGFRPNASQLSHAELDEAEELDEGDPAELAARPTTPSRSGCRRCGCWAAAAAPTRATSRPSGACRTARRGPSAPSRRYPFAPSLTDWPGAHRTPRPHRRRGPRACAGVTDLTMVLVLDGFLDAGNAAAHAARHLADLDAAPTARGRWWPPSTSTSSTTTGPGGRRCRSSATTTRPTTPRGWSSGCCATAAGRRTSCCTAPSPTTAGRRSPARCARSSSSSG